MEIQINDKEKNKFVREVAEQKYEYGFTTDVHTDIIPKGLNEDVVRLIAQVKGDDLSEDQFLFTGDIGIDLCEFIVSLVGLQCVDSAVGTIAEEHKLDAVEA